MSGNFEGRRLIYAMVFPFIMVFLMWVVMLVQYLFEIDLSELGILPRKISGLPGIITSPFIHADFSHLTANTVPLFVSLSVIFYLYREVAFRVMLIVYFATGLLVWLFARESYHIGASGLVYGYISFLLFSGIVRRNIRLMAVSLLMVFLYGGTFWGIFPDFFPERNISWESHLLGALNGFLLAIVFRRKGIQREVYHWEEDEGDNDTDTEDFLPETEEKDKV